jgi:L-alanine-DL-glutamate epimerase-like enolase superfamily enzyme
MSCKAYDLRSMDVEVIPAQAPEVEAAIAAAIGPDRPVAIDPWWQAGVDEALET